MPADHPHREHVDVPPERDDDGVARLVKRFERQASSAVQRSSPMYEALLTECANDIKDRGPVWSLLSDRASEPAGDALPLRLLAALHLLVLTGKASELETFYPSVGGRPTPAMWPSVSEYIHKQGESLIAPLLDRPLQTNEVRRCSALIVGIVWAAIRGHRQMTTLEVGASGGLNVNWHRYRYLNSSSAWGPHSSPVRLHVPANLDLNALQSCEFNSARGCDLEPLDISDAADLTWLRACVWADQQERLTMLDAALAVARRDPPDVARAEASEWLLRELDTEQTSGATVVMQSVVHQYLRPHQRDALSRTMDYYGARSTEQSPLAWLRVEPPTTSQGPDVTGLAEIRMHVWPENRDHLLGLAGFHGQPVLLT